MLQAQALRGLFPRILGDLLPLQATDRRDRASDQIPLDLMAGSAHQDRRDLSSDQIPLVLIAGLAQEEVSTAVELGPAGNEVRAGGDLAPARVR